MIERKIRGLSSSSKIFERDTPTNCSDWCLSLVFFSFQSILILVTLGTLDLRTMILYFYDGVSSIIYFCCSFVSPSRGKNPPRQQMRIHEGHFLKNALNLDLTLSNARSRQGDAARIFLMVVAAFCVELRPFYCNKKETVPM